MADSAMSQLPANEFDAVKAFVEALKRLEPKIQERALRYASEALGLQFPMPSQGTAGQLAPTADRSLPAPPVPSPALDIKSFMNKKAPRTDTQFAAAVAYYYRFEAPEAQRKNWINAKDLADAARLVSRRRPGNARITLHNAKNAGYLDAKGEGEFQINSVGENLVAMALPGDEHSEAPRPATKRRFRENKNPAGRQPRKSAKKK